MEEILGWLDKEWFSLLQSLGIIGSLLVATASARRESHARKISDALNLAQQHRDLWRDAHQRNELHRIFAKEADLVAQPISVAEEEFLNLVIMHFQMTWLLANQDGSIGIQALRSDAKVFFALPIPQRVWEKTKGERLAEFVAFIEGCFE